VAAVSRVVVLVVDVDVGDVWVVDVFGSRGNSKKVAPCFCLGCANVTKWSVRNLWVYKHLLFRLIPRALPTLFR
jgi:hypothetical protein